MYLPSTNGNHKTAFRFDVGLLPAEAKKPANEPIPSGYVRPEAVTTRADVEESLAFSDPDFAGLWVDYFDLNRPDNWFSYGPGTMTRRFGTNWPFFRTEQELAWYRAASRFVATRNPHASGLIGGLTAYVVGKGMSCKAYPRDKTMDPYDERLCRLVEDEIEAFEMRTNFRMLQQQIYAERLIDGEYFLQMFDMGDSLEIRGILPEFIRMPPGENWEEWSFGIQVPPEDPWLVQGYHVSDYNGGMGHFVRAEDMIHFPLAVPGRWTKGIKRAIPLFAFGVKDAFDNAGKLLRNMGIGVTIRQGFAIFRQWENISREGASEFVSASSDATSTRNVAGTPRTREIRYAEPGMVIDAPKGMQFAELPQSPETLAAVEVVGALLRNAVSIMNAPEWLASGDARNMGAYSSSMVAESPFVKRAGQEQEVVGNALIRVYRRLIDIAVRCGRLPVECKTRVKLMMAYETLETRNKNEEASQNNIYVQMGVKSRQQVAQEQGLDPDKQFADNIEWQRKTLEAQIKIEELKQQLQQLQNPDQGMMEDGGDGDAGTGLTLPGAETGGDDLGEDFDPFGDVAESIDLMEEFIFDINQFQVELMEADLQEEGATYHGPKPPGEGWVLAGKGKRGGKIWKKTKDSAGKKKDKATSAPIKRVTQKDIDVAKQRMDKATSRQERREAKMKFDSLTKDRNEFLKTQKAGGVSKFDLAQQKERVANSSDRQQRRQEQMKLDKMQSQFDAGLKKQVYGGVSMYDLYQAAEKLNSATSRQERLELNRRFEDLKAKYVAGRNKGKTPEKKDSKPKAKKQSKPKVITKAQPKASSASVAPEVSVEKQRNIVGNFFKLISSAWNAGDDFLANVNEKLDRLSDDAAAFAARSIRSAIGRAFNRSKKTAEQKSETSGDKISKSPTYVKMGIDSSMKAMQAAMRKLYLDDSKQRPQTSTQNKPSDAKVQR